jgi:PAS domain-containing protein
MTVAVEDLLAQCDLKSTGSGLVIDCPSISVANLLWEQRQEWIGITRLFHHNGRIKLVVKGQDFASPFNPFPERSLRNFSDRFRHSMDNELLRTPQKLEYRGILDLVRDSGDPVCITNHLTNTCLLMNDRFAPERITWMPAQYIGMNFLWLWRDSMHDFEVLQRELRQNGRIDNFTFRLRRVDGSMGEYTKDFFIAEDFLGYPARISISKDWRSLSLAH